MVFSVFRSNWNVVDRGVPHHRQPQLVELPILIPVRTKPIPRVVVPFVSEANRDPIVLNRPEFFDQAVIKLVRPFSAKEGDDLLSAYDEFSPVAPSALGAVGERNEFGVSRIPKILCRTNLLGGSCGSERRQWRSRFSCLCHHVSSSAALANASHGYFPEAMFDGFSFSTVASPVSILNAF
jgi:hypothetical protein